MKVKYIPIRSSGHINFKFTDEIIFLKIRNDIYKIDLSSFPNGRMESSIDYIPSVDRINGELHVELQQPIDVNGIPLEQVDFDTSDFTNVEVIWKTQEEIEEEKNAPQPKTEVEILQERLEATELALIELMMEG